MKKIALVAATTLIVSACDRLAPPVPAAPAPQSPPVPQLETRRVTYELQEKCAHDAYELYKHEWQEKPQGVRTIDMSYTNHYNNKLSRCFMDVSFLYANTAKGKVTDYQSRSLIDVLENREIGTLLMPMVPSAQVSECYVADQRCAGASTIMGPSVWEGLAKPYMEE